MNNERLEELAALHALNLLDLAGEKELLEAARRDPEVRELVRDFTETATLLAFEGPEIAPPSQLKQDLMRRLPARSAASRIIQFPQWVTYAIAACLMALGIVQTLQIVVLKSRVSSLQSGLVTADTEVGQLRQANAIKDLRLALLQEAPPAKADAAYAASHIMVAWDSTQHRGIVSMQNLPAPPPGHDYQLWVLDPTAPSPISAGVISGSRSFVARPVSTSKPGFAISLEPTGGRPTPTGPILFAASPEQ